MNVKYFDLKATLKLMKAELKRAFPATKFFVRCSRGTGYGYVSLKWTNGPTQERVTSITNGYQGSGFDGMTDCSYVITHVEADENGAPVTIHYGIKGIDCSRKISPAFARRLSAQVAVYYGVNVPALREYAGYDGTLCWEVVDRKAGIDGNYWEHHILRAASDSTTYSHFAVRLVNEANARSSCPTV